MMTISKKMRIRKGSDPLAPNLNRRRGTRGVKLNKNGEGEKRVVEGRTGDRELERSLKKNKNINLSVILVFFFFFFYIKFLKRQMISLTLNITVQ